MEESLAGAAGSLKFFQKTGAVRHSGRDGARPSPAGIVPSMKPVATSRIAHFTSHKLLQFHMNRQRSHLLIIFH